MHICAWVYKDRKRSGWKKYINLAGVSRMCYQRSKVNEKQCGEGGYSSFSGSLKYQHNIITH